IFEDWTAEGPAKAVVHIARNHGLCAGRSKVSCCSFGDALWTNAEQRGFVLIRQRVKPVPVIDLVPGAVKIVSSVFRDVIHHGTRIAAVLRAVIRQHLDLSNSVLITEEDHRTANGSVVVAL